MGSSLVGALKSSSLAGGKTERSIMVSWSSNNEAFFFLVVSFNFETQNIEAKLPVTLSLCMHDGFFGFFPYTFDFSPFLKISDCIVFPRVLYLQKCFLPFTSPLHSLYFFFPFRTPAMKHYPLGFLSLSILQRLDFIGEIELRFLSLSHLSQSGIYHSLAFCTLTRIAGLYLFYSNDYFLLLCIMKCGSWLAVRRLV